MYYVRGRGSAPRGRPLGPGPVAGPYIITYIYIYIYVYTYNKSYVIIIVTISYYYCNYYYNTYIYIYIYIHTYAHKIETYQTAGTYIRSVKGTIWEELQRERERERERERLLHHNVEHHSMHIYIINQSNYHITLCHTTLQD